METSIPLQRADEIILSFNFTDDVGKFTSGSQVAAVADALGSAFCENTVISCAEDEKAASYAGVHYYGKDVQVGVYCPALASGDAAFHADLAWGDLCTAMEGGTVSGIWNEESENYLRYYVGIAYAVEGQIEAKDEDARQALIDLDNTGITPADFTTDWQTFLAGGDGDYYVSDLRYDEDTDTTAFDVYVMVGNYRAVNDLTGKASPMLTLTDVDYTYAETVLRDEIGGWHVIDVALALAQSVGAASNLEEEEPLNYAIKVRDTDPDTAESEETEWVDFDDLALLLNAATGVWSHGYSETVQFMIRYMLDDDALADPGNVVGYNGTKDPNAYFARIYDEKTDYTTVTSIIAPVLYESIAAQIAYVVSHNTVVAEENEDRDYEEAPEDLLDYLVENQVFILPDSIAYEEDYTLATLVEDIYDEEVLRELVQTALYEEKIVIHVTARSDEVLNARIVTDQTDVILAALTPREIAEVLMGYTEISLELLVETTKLTNVPDNVRNAVRAQTTDREELYYFDADLYKVVNGTKSSKIENLDGAISIRFDIPTEILLDGREYRLIRTHDTGGGIEASVLADDDEDGTTYTITTDRFCTMVFAYADRNDAALDDAENALRNGDLKGAANALYENGDPGVIASVIAGDTSATALLTMAPGTGAADSLRLLLVLFAVLVFAGGEIFYLTMQRKLS